MSDRASSLDSSTLSHQRRNRTYTHRERPRRGVIREGKRARCAAGDGRWGRERGPGPTEARARRGPRVIYRGRLCAVLFRPGRSRWDSHPKMRGREGEGSFSCLDPTYHGVDKDGKLNSRQRGSLREYVYMCVCVRPGPQVRPRLALQYGAPAGPEPPNPLLLRQSCKLTRGAPHPSTQIITNPFYYLVSV